MKTSREQLKSFVKELLVEILQEGLSMNAQSHKKASIPVKSQSMQRRPTFDPFLDSPVNTVRRPSSGLQETIKREAAGSSVMASILTDTAQTTLQTQLANGDSMMGGQPGRHMPVQQEHVQGDLEDIFGPAATQGADGMSHWAELAFMRPKKPT